MLASTEHRMAGWHVFRPASSGGDRRAKRQLLILLVAAFLLVQIAPSNAAQTPKKVRRVLVFSDFGSVSSPGIALLARAIADGLEHSPYQIELYDEDLQTALFPDDASQSRFREWYIRKYSDRKPDVIVTVGPASLKFMVESHAKSFPDIPVVFCGSTEEMIGQFKPDSNFVGVWGVVQPERTLMAALHLQPGTRHVVVVGGTGEFDRKIESIVKQSFHDYESKLDFTYLTDMKMPALLGRLRQLPSNTIVFHTSLMEDAAGSHFINSTQSVPMISNASNAPVFGVFDMEVGNGTVGGDVVSWEADGRLAAGMAVRILNGERPLDIPVMRGSNVYLFDWRALHRWGLRERDLPPDSVVLFRELTIWERTKWIWTGVLAIIFGLTAFATYLHFSRKQLELARNTQLRLSGLLINAQEKERSRLASELHDDFSQRLALLALGLDNAVELLSEAPDQAKQQLHDLLNSASELGADLHTLSHRLHSSTLENLGLVPGICALCREFSTQQGIEVDFKYEAIPASVHPDVALCLFRIVQEGLRNLKKHSCATEAQVSLRKVGDSLLVRIFDKGVGFDVRELKSKNGLGIRSMEERANLLGGWFEISSKRGQGTRIEACVPLQPKPEVVSG